jgi:toxin HigB-1
MSTVSIRIDASLADAARVAAKAALRTLQGQVAFWAKVGRAALDNPDFLRGSKAGIRPDHALRLQLQLGALDQATGPQDMAVPGWKLHPLKGGLAGHWAVAVNGNWRLTFRFVGADAELVDYQDYH